MTTRELAFLYCNLDFIEIFTESKFSAPYCKSPNMHKLYHKDPCGDDFYLSHNECLKVLGNALISALSKSRILLSLTKEESEYVEKSRPPYPADVWKDGSIETLNKLSEQYKKWGEEFLEKWLDNDQERRLFFDEELVKKREDEWLNCIMKKYNYKNKTALFKNMQSCSVSQEKEEITFLLFGQREARKGDFKVVVPSDASPFIIGAAVKYSIARCTGKGADLVAKKLFPDGVPESFDEYVKSINVV